VQAEAKRTQAEERKATLETETTDVKQRLQQEAAQVLDKKKQQRQAVQISLAKQTQHIARQEIKRNALNAVLQDAYQQVVSLPAEEYTATLLSYAKQQKLQPEEIKSVLAPTARKTETEQILSTLQVTAPVEYSEKMVGGVVLHGEDYAIDFSFERIYQDAVPSLEGVAAKVLFPSN
jgi:vacuolar-type H+-ATPase subunit E/Vma4